MIGNFINTYKRLLQATDFACHRYLFNDFNMKNRLTGLVGARGVGKTTLLLQFIKEKIDDSDECIYAAIDNLYFSSNLLSDFVDELYEEYGVRNFFLDEIHKYPNWNQELKNIYDSYPEIKIVFSGSSSIDLIKGAYDLSRRGVLVRMAGMSFREYLLFNGIADIAPITFAKNLGIDNKTIQNYLQILSETGLVELLKEDRSGSRILKNTEKMYLDNPDLYHAIVAATGYQVQVGTVREIFFIKMLKNSGHKVHYSRVGDFVVNDIIFEVGGKSSKKQITNKLEKAYLVKDDILYGSKYEIPLYLFGFLY
jgi:predicted AAA+ superfamily ATPase